MDESADPSTNNASALDAMRAKREELLSRRRRLLFLRENIERDLRRVDNDLVHLSAAARLFGGDLPYPEPAPAATEKVVRHWVAHPSRDMERRPILPPVDAPPTATSAPKTAQMPLPAAPKIKQVVLDRLRATGEKGTKAAEIRQFILATYGLETHEKTVGMTLYRHLKAGLARREGATWFFVPPKAEKKNPGGETPGPSTVFD